MITQKSGANLFDGHEVARTADGREHENVLKPKFYIAVEDENGRPLFDARSDKDSQYEVRYRIHQVQDTKKDEGTLDQKGRAFFENCDPRKPFRFEIEGRVCAIKEGATFLLEQLDKSLADGGIEYGGTFFDWTWAEDDSPSEVTDKNGNKLKRSEVFWHEYARVREGANRYDVARLSAKANTRQERTQKGRNAIVAADKKHEESIRRRKLAQERFDSVHARTAARDRATSSEYAAAEKDYKLAKKEEEATGRALDAALAGGISGLESDIDTLEHLVKAQDVAPDFTTFWQHEHITRRDIRIRKKYLDEFPARIVVIRAMPVQVRVGPLVRFTSHDAATIWLELETPGLVRVTLLGGATRPPKISMIPEVPLAIRYGTSIRVGGRHFALVQIDGLNADKVYAYRFALVPPPAVGQIPIEQSDFTPEVFPAKLHPSILDDMQRQLRVCAFGDAEWLNFRTLKKSYKDDLRFAYGSCRSSRGDGDDALAWFGQVLAKANRDEWPHFALFIGDQIYADQLRDDLGDAAAAQRFASRLPGPADPAIGGAWAGRLRSRVRPIAEFRAEVASGDSRRRRLLEEHRKTRSHDAIEKLMKPHGNERMELFPRKFLEQQQTVTPMRFQHSINNHLLWEIPVEPHDVPQVTASDLHRVKKQDGELVDKHVEPAGDTGIHAADFAEYAYMYEAAWGGHSVDQQHVRRVLAHLPTFMIFDDHEACDDWNFDAEWVGMIEASSDPDQHWPKTIRDALAAYWIYQGWGNLDPRKSGADKRVTCLTNSQKDGSDALPEFRKLLDRTKEAIPPSRIDATGRLEWYYKLPIEGSTRILVLDGRTQRVMGRTAAESVVMTNNQWTWMQGELLDADRNGQPAVFIVAADPVLLPPVLSAGQRAQLLKDSITTRKGVTQRLARRLVSKDARRSTDIEHWAVDGSWNRIRDVFRDLAKRAPKVKSVVFLSGDVHFSYNMVGSVVPDDPMAYPHMVQMVSSPIKTRLDVNREFKMRKLAEPDPRALAGQRHTLGTLGGDMKFTLLRQLSLPEVLDEVDGIYLMMAGIEGMSNPYQTALSENAVAVVDAFFPNGKFMLREYYVIPGKDAAPEATALTDAPWFGYDAIDDELRVTALPEIPEERPAF